MGAVAESDDPSRAKNNSQYWINRYFQQVGHRVAILDCIFVAMCEISAAT